MRVKENVEISSYVTLSFDVTCALLMRSYINRFFFRNIFKAIQLSILFYILTKIMFDLISSITYIKNFIID